MKKILSIVALLVVFGSVFLVSCPVLANNTTINSSNNDGFIFGGGNANYTIAWNGTTSVFTPDYNSTYFSVGQYHDGGLYFLSRGFLYFNTSNIALNATINSAYISLYLQSPWATNFTLTNFNVTLQNGMPLYPNTPIQQSDYNQANYAGDGGSTNTTELTIGGRLIIPLNTTGLSWINKGGITKLCLRSGNDIEFVAPTLEEFISFYSSENASYYQPQLNINYTLPTYTLNYTAGTGGTIIGVILQYVQPGFSGTAVIAVPSSGHKFSGWSDGSTQNPRTDTNVIANLSVIANFYVPPVPVVVNTMANIIALVFGVVVLILILGFAIVESRENGIGEGIVITVGGIVGLIVLEIIIIACL